MLSIVAVTVLATVGLSEAEATNWNNVHWPINNVVYKCISVDSITHTSNVNPCGDLNTSSNIWEVSGSNLTLNPTTGTYNIAAYSWTSGVSGAGKYVINVNGLNEITYGYIAMNRNLNWEDSAVNTSSSGYDWRSATGHEFGHTIGMGHSTDTSSSMYTPLSNDEVRRGTTSHDKSHVSGAY